MPNNYHKIIGIDLGTTFSVVSSFNLDTGKPEAFEVPGMQPPRCIFPSVVSVSRQGKLLVGWPGKRNLPANPQNTVIEVKRKIGQPEEIPLAGQKFSPQMVSAFTLKELKTIAEQKIGFPIHDAVITVPAYFHDHQRSATEDAARIAQLNPRLLINEPTAAAIAYGLDKLTDEERIFIVYDLGGGTFDVSVILVAGSTIEVMGTAGDDQLGGGDFDDRITEWVFSQLERDHPSAAGLRHRPDIWTRVKAAAEQAKIDLSGMDSAVVEAPNLTADINLYYDIDRATFIALLQEPRPRENRKGKPPIGLLDETLESVDDAFESARRNFKERQGREITFDDVTEFLLVGGSTRIPVVKEMLETRFKRPVRFDPEIVDKAVSLGAAILGRQMDPMDSFEGTVIEVPWQPGATVSAMESAVRDLQVVDVTGHSLGIGIAGDHFRRIIHKDTELPASVPEKDQYSTQHDNQPSVTIPVFQGEDPIASNNSCLGEIRIENLEPRPSGYHLFDVTFNLGLSGVLDVLVEHFHCPDMTPRSKLLQKAYPGQFKSEGVTRLSRDQVEESRRKMRELLEKGVDPGVPLPHPAMPAATVPPQIFSVPQVQPAASATPLYQPPFQNPAPQPSAPQPATPPLSQPSSTADLEARIPVDFRDTWKRAGERAAALEGARKQILQTAIKYFEEAVQAGNPDAILDYGKAMVETYFSMLR